MNKGYFQANISGSFLVLLLVFSLGIILGLVIIGTWDLSTGETVAIFIATITFASSFYHFYSLRRHHRLSVKPYLQINSTFDNTTKDGFYTFRVRLHNYGLGPAIVEKRTVELDGVETTDVHNEYEEWVKLSNSVTMANGEVQCSIDRYEISDAIDKGQSITLLSVNFPVKDIAFMQARETAKELSSKINIVIKYQSHYGESFTCLKGELA